MGNFFAKKNPNAEESHKTYIEPMHIVFLGEKKYFKLFNYLILV